MALNHTNILATLALHLPNILAACPVMIAGFRGQGVGITFNALNAGRGNCLTMTSEYESALRLALLQMMLSLAGLLNMED